MRKFLVLFLFTMISMVSFGQVSIPKRVAHLFSFKKYEVVDSLPIERLFIHSPFDYDDETVVSMGEGNYLINAPHKDNMIIRRNADNTKAIVVYNSYCFGRHKEFNVKENDKRIILWYEDDHCYCGYVYDKEYKACRYLEERY